LTLFLYSLLSDGLQMILKNNYIFESNFLHGRKPYLLIINLPDDKWIKLKYCFSQLYLPFCSPVYTGSISKRIKRDQEQIPKLIQVRLFLHLPKMMIMNHIQKNDGGYLLLFKIR
jgi:hypothetical protein